MCDSAELVGRDLLTKFLKFPILKRVVFKVYHKSEKKKKRILKWSLKGRAFPANTLTSMQRLSTIMMQKFFHEYCGNNAQNNSYVE